MLKTALKIIFFLDTQSKVREVKTSLIFLVALVGLLANAVFSLLPLFILNINSFYSGSMVILGTKPGSFEGLLNVILMLIPLLIQSVILNALMIILSSAILGFFMSLFLKKEHISFGKSFQLMLLHSVLISLLLLLPLPGVLIFVYLIGGMIIRTVLLKRESGVSNQPSHFTPLPQNPL